MPGFPSIGLFAENYQKREANTGAPPGKSVGAAIGRPNSPENPRKKAGGQWPPLQIYSMAFYNEE